MMPEATVDARAFCTGMYPPESCTHNDTFGGFTLTRAIHRLALMLHMQHILRQLTGAKGNGNGYEISNGSVSLRDCDYCQRVGRADEQHLHRHDCVT